MEAIRHLELLREEGDRVADLPADTLHLPVPTLPDWSVERVVRHLGKIHRWVAATLAAGPDADVAATASGLPSMPKGPDCLPAYREALDHVLVELSRHDPDEAVATFVGVGTAGFWMRRQAHEVAVHRIDAADAIYAAGGPTPDSLAVDGAVDAIDEWAHVFLANRWTATAGNIPAELVGRSVHVHGTDDPAPVDGAEWLFTFGEDRVDVVPTHAKGDVALRGPAADLLLVLWRRRPLEMLDVVGDRSVAEHLIDAVRF
ncbi:MAG: maleylpyruvate isomerase N-terminal domain-containing protein [Aquihabitans sp.]